MKKHGGSVLVLALSAVNYPGVLGGKIIKPADKFSVLSYNLGSGSPEADELQQHFPGGRRLSALVRTISAVQASDH